MSYNMLQKLILFISAIGMSACASIPHATVELSTLLGKQIDAIEQSHVATINAYYTEKEKTFIDFIDKTWYPQYLERLFAEPTTIEYWNEVLSEELPQRIVERIYRDDSGGLLRRKRDAPHSIAR